MRSAMPEIVFKGKEYVYNHHLTVPYRPLVVHADKGIGPPDLAGNLIVHGDNLSALKSLLPRYAGKVDLIFIDPPYNTGNEGWCYSDNVNSPIMREWLSNNPVDGEDLLRHDKWLCMMWPRLVLLRELLSDRGSIWMTLDDNEVHRARMVMDEMFGEGNHIATVVWANKVSPANDAAFFSKDHDSLLVFAKSAFEWNPGRLERSADQEALYTNPDSDPRGPWNSLTLTNNKSSAERPNLHYAIRHPSTGREVWPPDGTVWRVSKEQSARLEAESKLYWGVEGTAKLPRVKRFLSEVGGVVPRDVWSYDRFGSTQSANLELQQLGLRFPTPKPTPLLDAVVAIGASSDSLILDSFAGSGTTAHAVLKANARDGGTRRFILVEGEDYADTLTAERVRRVIKGYAWKGTQRETLFEQKLTLTQLKKADTLLAEIDKIEAREGLAQGDLADQGSAAAERRFERIEAKVDDGVFRIEGVRSISDSAPGLGGGFTYCTLGEPLSLEKMLSGEALPTREALAEWLFHTATGGTLPPPRKGAPQHYLAATRAQHVWLVYEPDLAFLKSPAAALTLPLAQTLAAWGREADAASGERHSHLVFAPAKYLSHAQLREHGVEFAALPFALYRES
jgi:adenine-specific DNA-methyltransferase